MTYLSYLPSVERSAVDSFTHSSSRFVSRWKELWQSKMSCLLVVVSYLNGLWRDVSVQSRMTKVVKRETIHCWLVQTSSSSVCWMSAEGFDSCNVSSTFKLARLGASAVTGLARLDMDYWLDPMWKHQTGSYFVVWSCHVWNGACKGSHCCNLHISDHKKLIVVIYT